MEPTHRLLLLDSSASPRKHQLLANDSFPSVSLHSYNGDRLSRAQHDAPLVAPKPPSSTMPRLVRRQPLIERVKAQLDPYDLLLWLSEELNDDAYDEWLKLWATPIAVALNITFIFARAWSGVGASRSNDDVFGDDGSSGSGWLAWMVRTTQAIIMCTSS